MLKKVILIIIILIITLLVTLQFPNLFVDKKIDYKSFKLYLPNDIELNEDVKVILDSISINLEQSKFYNKNQRFELYFIQGTLYEKLIGLFGSKNIASSKFDKHIYIGEPRFKDGILFKANNDFEWLNLVQIITHECVHSQMYIDHSKLGFMKTPSWINEGYSEYISYRPIRLDNNYQLSELFKRYEMTDASWMKTEYQSMTPRQYVEDRIIIEYLIDYKQMSISEIIKDESLEPNKLLAEIKHYFTSQK